MTPIFIAVVGFLVSIPSSETNIWLQLNPQLVFLAKHAHKIFDLSVRLLFGPELIVYSRSLGLSHWIKLSSESQPNQRNACHTAKQRASISSEAL